MVTNHTSIISGKFVFSPYLLNLSESLVTGTKRPCPPGSVSGGQHPRLSINLQEPDRLLPETVSRLRCAAHLLAHIECTELALLVALGHHGRLGVLVEDGVVTRTVICCCFGVLVVTSTSDPHRLEMFS